MKNTSRSCLDAAVPPLPKLLVILLLLSSVEMVVGLRARKLLLLPPLQDKSVLCLEQEVPLLKIRIVTAKRGMLSRRKILLLAQNKTISNSEEEKSSLKIDTGSGISVMPPKQGMVSKRRIPPSNSNPTQNKLKPRFSGSRNP